MMTNMHEFYIRIAKISYAEVLKMDRQTDRSVNLLEFSSMNDLTHSQPSARELAPENHCIFETKNYLTACL